MAISWSVFDVLGPVMVGPSSSHTAGACLIGYMARAVHGQPFQSVTIELHGSFAEVYAGHATDRALLAGVMSALPHDDSIRDAFSRAAEQGITYSFLPTHLGEDFHPNTARITFDGDDTHAVIGSSLGGGKAALYQIGKMPVELSPEYAILLVFFDAATDRSPDIIATLSRAYTLADIRTYRYKDRTLLALHSRTPYATTVRAELEQLPSVLWARIIPHPSHLAAL